MKGGSGEVINRRIFGDASMLGIEYSQERIQVKSGGKGGLTQ